MRVGHAILVLAFCVAASGARGESRPPAAGWIDALWVDHLVQRGGQVAGAPVFSEAFFRDALKVDPCSTPALEALARRYRENREPALTAAAVLYGRLLEPARPAWDELWTWAAPLVERGPGAPSGREAKAQEEGLEAMLAALRSNQFISAERQLRALMRDAPRDGRLVENLASLGGLTRQPAMAALSYAYLGHLYPSNFHVANNLAALLESLARPGAALDVLLPFVPLNPGDRYVLGHAARLADGAGRHAEACDLAARWRTARPEEAEAWMASARCALRVGRADEARAYWQEVRRRASPAQQEDWLGRPPFAEHPAAWWSEEP